MGRPMRTHCVNFRINLCNNYPRLETLSRARFFEENTFHRSKWRQRNCFLIHDLYNQSARAFRNSEAFYFLTRTLKQSIFGLLILKPNVNWLFASYTLIFMKKYLAGLNTLRTPPNQGSQNWTKIDGVCVGS